MDHSPTSTLDRRSFLKAALGFGKAAAAARLLSPGLPMLGSAMLSQAKAPTPEPLIQPPAELRSANGVLEATITAAPGPVRLGDRALTGSFTMAPISRRRCARASATRCGSRSATT
jgi:suppressor of ftsI